MVEKTMEKTRSSCQKPGGLYIRDLKSMEVLPIHGIMEISVWN